MDREPKDAPFPVGTRLRYVGTRESYSINRRIVDGKVVEERLPIIHPGYEVTIARVTKGHRGTLRQLSDYDGPMYFEDSGESILDVTEDSCSVYDSPGGGRLIRWDGDWQDWKVITDGQ